MFQVASLCANVSSGVIMCHFWPLGAFLVIWVRGGGLQVVRTPKVGAKWRVDAKLVGPEFGWGMGPKIFLRDVPV